MREKTTHISSPEISDYITYFIYRAFEFFLRLLPMPVVCMIGSAIGQIAYMMMPLRRETVIRNLRIVYGNQLDLTKVNTLTRMTFRFSGANLISSIPASIMPPSELIDRVDIQGRENLQDAIKQGHGCIFLLAHMGNWEILTQLRILCPEIVSLASLYRPLNNPLLDRLIKRRRQKKGANLFSRKEGFTKSISHLKQGGCLGVIADQHAGAKGLAVPLFGKLTSMTNLPALLHRKTKAPILPISMCTVSHGKWKVIFHPALDIKEESRQDANQLTCQTARAYESLMLKSPADVLWMHGYWKTGEKGPLKVDGLQKKRAGVVKSSVTKPFRIIVYTGSAEQKDQETNEQLNRLKNYRSDIHITSVGESRFSATDAFIYTRPGLNSPALAYELERYNLSLETPLDCALDFTHEGHGGELFQKAKLTHVYTFYGKHQSRRTANYFSKITEPSIANFLTSLGIED